MARKPRDTLIDSGERRDAIPAIASQSHPATETATPLRLLDADVTQDSVVTEASPAFSAAVQRCLTEPQEGTSWDVLEQLAEGSETAHVAELYRTTLQRPLPLPVLLELAARAVRFHDGWGFGDEALITLLVRVLDIDPTVKWAFDRVSLELTMRARSDELLSLYDRVLGAVGAGPRQSALLEEAADVAREAPGQLDRAIGYLQRLFALDPRREAIAGSLERLLGQQRRHDDLLALWTRRMEVEGPREAGRLRVRAASFCVDVMGDPAAALTTLAPLESAAGEASSSGEAAPEAEKVWGLLERILGAPSSSPATQREALARLRRRCDARGRKTNLVGPLRSALGRAEGAEVVSIHGEIARRLVEDGRDLEAVPDLAAVISLDPVACDGAWVDAALTEAADVAVAGCRPRLDLGSRLDLVRAAARHAAARTGGEDRAARLYERLLREMKGDGQIIAGLDALYRATERYPDLIDLRRHELALATDVSRRQALRLDMARLHLLLGDAEAAVETLRAILDEAPTDPGTVAAGVTLLETNGRFEELATLLEEHAARMNEAAPDLAAELWGRAAEVAENKLSDVRRAMRDHERVVVLSQASRSLDALGRMHAALGEHGAAAAWLAKLVAAARPEEHASDVFRLASAHVAVGQAKEALASIEACLRTHPAELRLRLMQIELLRAADDKEALVNALADAAPHAAPPLESSLLREAAKILAGDLGAPARAVPLLESAVALPGADVSVRIELAETLYRAGRSDEARRHAIDVLSDFGRRHPPERAGVHFLLGCIAHDRGQGEAALRELESAVAMDVGNPRAQLMLGRVSVAVGKLDRAERAFHALLLLQRRSEGAGGDGPSMSETLLELHRLAAQRGDAQRAAENLAAAFDVATRSEREARGLEYALREAGMSPLLLSALESHLARATDVVSRVALFSEMATVLGALGRDDEAVVAALRGLALAPGDPDLHERAHAACLRTGELARYTESLEPLIAAALDRGDGVLGCDLLLRLGDAFENDQGQLDAADAAYARAEDTSEQLIEVWRRKARVATRRGDQDTRRTVLRKLAASASELGVTERVETLYALADLELGARETVDAGLDTLKQALLAEARPIDATEALRNALAVAVDLEPISQLYEAVARAHGDDVMLLDALLVASSLPSATQPLLREAVEIAERLSSALGGKERVERLLERAVLVAAGKGDAADALWAMRQLVRVCEQNGDLRAALSWSRQAADVADAEDSSAMRAQAAAFATAIGDIDGAVECYERLLGSDPSDARVWVALLDLLRKSGDASRLDAALLRAIDESRDPLDRIQLRMERARLAIAQGDSHAARATLHAVLDEQPDESDAVELLAGLLDPLTDRDEIVGLLRRQLEIVREANDAAAATPLVLKLAEIHSRASAADIVREALGWIPASAPLLQRLVDLLDADVDGPERADTLERLLVLGGEPGQRAWALDLVRARIASGDTEGVERAIERLSAVDPAHAQVHVALEWLARAKVAQAGERSDAGTPLLLGAARIFGRLGLADAALETLEIARAAKPDDPDVLSLAARLLWNAGRADEALGMITQALARATAASVRGQLLAVRASLRTAAGDHDAAVLDLEDACATDGDRWLPELLGALDASRVAAEAEDTGDALSVALRQALVLEQLGRPGDARALLAALAGDDVNVLRRVLELDVAAEQWDAVIEDCARLLRVVDPAEVSDLALSLADACVSAGCADAARPELERAHDADPTNDQLLERLRELYLRAGAHRELANRLFIEAQRTTDDERRFDRLLEVGRLRVEELGAAATAVGPLSDALALRPGHREATLLLADAFAAAGLTEDAEGLLRAAIAEHGGRRSRAVAELQQRMARVAAKQDPRAALRWLVQALESYPKSAEIAEELASLATSLGDFDVALRALRVLTSKELEPVVRARAYVAQAEIALVQANAGRAVALVRKALAETPDLGEAHELLRRLGRSA